MPFVGIVFGLILFFFHQYGIADIFVVTLFAFLASDILAILFVSGGNGILQIPLFGSKTQPKGYGFIAFFISILLVAILVNILTEQTVAYISLYFSDITSDILVGLGLASLVYLDMNAKFYAH